MGKLPAKRRRKPRLHVAIQGNGTVSCTITHNGASVTLSADELMRFSYVAALQCILAPRINHRE